MSYPPLFKSCPVCKKGVAMLGCSRWSYGGLVCSDACGEAASAAVDRVRKSPAYKAMRERIEKDSYELRMMELNALPRRS